MNYFEYLWVRFTHTWIAQALWALLMLPVLIVFIPVFIVLSPFAWAWDVYDEWREFKDEK